MRVEVGIEYNNGICRRQIDTDASCSSTQNVDEDVGVGLVELVHVFLPLGLLGASILKVM